MRPLLLSLLPLVVACRTGDKVVDDAVGVDTGALDAVDEDGDGFSADEDCDDSDASINAGAVEVCDGVDNDCDGEIDEGVTDTWYADADADGYGDPDAAVEGCTQPAGTASSATDCDDADAEINPVASERCDGVDNDCDGSIDEDVRSTWYADADGDGFGDPDATLDDCDPPSGYTDDATDCDDAAAAVNPDADEVCNEIDDDCDGVIDGPDSVDATTWYADADGDGYGDAAAPTTACAEPSGAVADATDCDDVAFEVNPGATEVCNAIDDDCDGDIDDDDASLDASTATTWYDDDDADGYGDAAAATTACAQPSGAVTDATDCDDAAAAVNPGQTEVCNRIDDDCDGDIDDDDASLDAATATTWYADADADGYGDAAAATTACAQPSGTVTDATDCDDAAAAVNPGETEVCNSIDDDCDGDIDDDDASLDTSTATTWYDDDDADGYGDPTASTDACVQPSGTVTDATDCDDTDADAWPGALERLTGSDTDCDGTVDEAAVAVVFAHQCLASSGSTSYTAAELTDDEEDALSDHLDDLALGLDRYDEPTSGWATTSLSDYNLLLMSKCGWGWDAVNQGMLDELLDQRDAGTPTFVFGDDMSWHADEVTDSDELILMANGDDNGSPGPVTVTPAATSTHAVLSGSYGTVSSFSYDRDIDETTTWGNGETVLATRGSSSRPVWVAFEDSTTGVRQASYLGNIDTCNHVRLNSTARAESEVLFQNTVEWLLDL